MDAVQVATPELELVGTIATEAQLVPIAVPVVGTLSVKATEPVRTLGDGPPTTSTTAVYLIVSPLPKVVAEAVRVKTAIDVPTVCDTALEVDEAK